VADARHLAALRAHELDVAGVQRAFTLDDPALDVALRVRSRMALDDVHALDDETVLLGEHLEHSPALAAVLAGRDDDRVVAANRCV
jgi:hypothetical protein